MAMPAFVVDKNVTLFFTVQIRRFIVKEIGKLIQ